MIKDEEKENDTGEIDVDDVTFVDEEENSNPQAVIKKLRDKLRASETERQEYLTGWQKAKADFINLRKKDEEMGGQAIKFAKADLISDLIPVLDSFDLAFSHKKTWEELPKDWRIGIESIYNQLITVLTNSGVTKVVPLNEKFDPRLHEAITTIPTDKKEEDHLILEVFQPGYAFHGNTLRPAKVKVGEYQDVA